MTTSEHDLIGRVIEGDVGAFTSLVEKYQGPISHAIIEIVGDRDLAADITQRAFISAFEHLSSYDPAHRFFSWLYRIAWNDAINCWHRQKFCKPLDHFELPSNDPSPEDRLMAKERMQNLEHAMGLLAYKYRVVLVLRHFLDLSYAEIGQIVDLPVSTVRSRIHTARSQLRAELTAQLSPQELSLV